MTAHQQATAQDTSMAKRASQVLSRYVEKGRTLHLKIAEEGEPAELLALPSSVLPFLRDALEAVSNGTSVTLLSEEEELTTSQAAEILGVSRPFLVKLLEGGELSYRIVGSHRRLTVGEVMSYKEKTKKKRKEVLEQLAAEAQELGLGY